MAAYRRRGGPSGPVGLTRGDWHRKDGTAPNGRTTPSQQHSGNRLLLTALAFSQNMRGRERRARCGGAGSSRYYGVRSADQSSGNRIPAARRISRESACGNPSEEFGTKFVSPSASAASRKIISLEANFSSMP